MSQANRLTSAKELLIHKAPGKMSEFFPLLLEFQASGGTLEKQRVIEVVMDCVDAVPQLSYLSAATGCVRQMLNDSYLSVVKSAILATKRLVVLSLHALSYSSEAQKVEARSHWQALVGVIDTVISPTLTQHRNQGVKILAFKLMEQIVLMTSAVSCPGLKGAHLHH